MSTRQLNAIPSLLRGLVDDAAVFPPGNAALPDALTAHRQHRNAWYADLVGPLLLPASLLPQLPGTDEPLRVGLIADTGIDAVAQVLAQLPAGVEITHVEAKAADDAALSSLVAASTRWGLRVFAEIPMTGDVSHALRQLGPTSITPKFRTGGETPEAFPSARALAEAITGCAEQGLSFKLTAGLHRAVRHTDPATGFTHHGFANVLVAAAEADSGSGVASVTDTLTITESEPLRDRIRGMLAHPRPLWVGFGSCSITEPLEDLSGLSLVYEEN